MIMNFIRGMCMAFADSVPGVSGGTIAFVMGFYSQFIDSLRALMSRSSKEEKKAAIIFLCKIGVGWIFGMALSVLFIASVFESNIYAISSLFIGFIVFSIPLIYKEEKETIKGHAAHVIYLVIGIVVVSLLTYINSIIMKNTGSTSSNFSIGFALYTIIAGMIAISAMVLPGISGSTLMLIFGLYTSIIQGIEDLLHFDFNALPLLFTFGIGVLLGIAGVIKLLSNLLHTKRSQLIYLIFGLMIGSLYAVVMGPTTLDIPQAPLSLGTFNIFFFLIGAVIILGLEKLKTMLQ